MIQTVILWVENRAIILLQKVVGVKMIDLYIALIIAGKRDFSKVPSKFQMMVKEELEALGLDENGNPVKE